MSGRMDSSGISTVVGLILVLGLIVSVAAVIKIAYIPDVKKQLEADHMQHVIADFSSFKTQLDMDQAASAATGVGYAASASVEMGGGAIPGIDPSSSYGTLSLDPSYGQLTITAYDYMSGARMDLGSATALGRLIYQSNNHYYANQNLSYECGMVMLSQPGGSIMLAPPSLTISADPDVADRPIVSMNAVRLNGTAQSFSSSGTGTIRTWLIPGSTAYASTNITNVTFTIISNYAQQWNDYLNGMLVASGLSAENYALSRPDARTVVLRVNATGTQSTGLFLADSSFGTAMGYTSMPPGLATPVPSPTSTPPGPLADFTYSTSNGMPLRIVFTDRSVGNPTSWSWDFGDGGTSTIKNPTYTYASAGSYTVTLTATNSSGTNSVTRTVRTPPVAAFTWNSGSLTVTFTDTTAGSPEFWQWSFGDGTANSTLQSPTHTYASAGTYTVRMVASNGAGSNGVAKTVVVTVTPVPITVTSTIGNIVSVGSNGAWKTYQVNVTLSVRNTGTAQASSVLGSCPAPTGNIPSDLRNIRLLRNPTTNPQNIAAGATRTYVWCYQFEIKSGKTATFSLTAQGTNTNLATTTSVYTSP